MHIYISNGIQVVYAHIHAITEKNMNLKKSKDGSTGVWVAGRNGRQKCTYFMTSKIKQILAIIQEVIVKYYTLL